MAGRADSPGGEHGMSDEHITNAQHELAVIVKDWKYDYGADDKECIAMLSWMILRLKPDAEIGPGSL